MIMSRLSRPSAVRTAPSVAPRRRRIAALGLAATMFVLVSCSDDRASVAPPRPAPLPVSANAWLLLSDSAARPGAELTLSAFAKSDTGGAVGSFTARFLYDTLQLAVIGTDSVGDATLRAVNPTPGEYRVAGAAARGIPGGLLFRLRLRVIDARGLRRLGLLVDELHSVALHDLTPKLTVTDGRADLFSGMKGVRVAPPPGRTP